MSDLNSSWQIAQGIWHGFLYRGDEPWNFWIYLYGVPSCEVWMKNYLLELLVFKTRMIRKGKGDKDRMDRWGRNWKKTLRSQSSCNGGYGRGQKTNELSHCWSNIGWFCENTSIWLSSHIDKAIAMQWISNNIIFLQYWKYHHYIFWIEKLQSIALWYDQ